MDNVKKEEKSLIAAVFAPMKEFTTREFWIPMVNDATRAVISAIILTFFGAALDYARRKLGINSPPHTSNGGYTPLYPQHQYAQQHSVPIQGNLSNRVFGGGYTGGYNNQQSTPYASQTPVQTYPTVSPTGDERFPGLTLK